MKKIIIAILTFVFVQSFACALNVPSGSIITIQPQNEIDADDYKTGDTINFTLVQPLKYNNNIIIKAGSEVTGTVVKNKNNGCFGIPGEIQISNFRIIDANQGDVRLRGSVISKGESKYWVNVGWIFLITIPMVFIKGQDAKVPMNSTYMLYTAEDIDI